MITCTCGEEFETQESAEEHVTTIHADVCDQKLEEYIADSQRDACEEMLSGEEEEC